MRDSVSAQARLETLSKSKTRLLGLLLQRKSVSAQPIRQYSRNKSGPVQLPISGAQQRLWFIDQLEGASTAYHTPLTVRIVGHLVVPALQRAMDTLVCRHEVLRSVFVKVDGEAVQQIMPIGSCTLQSLDLTTLDALEREAAVLRYSHEELSRPFDLTTGPLIRSLLLRLSPSEHVMLITMHHIVSDGWSLGVLLRELTALYEAEETASGESLPSLSIQYGDYACWQREWLETPDAHQQLEYWREHLRDAPELLELPLDRPRPAVQSYRGGNAQVSLSVELTLELKKLAEQHNVTVPMILHAAWSILLSRLSGQQDIVIGIPVANRSRTEFESLIGFFVNTLAVRVRLNDGESVSDLLRRVRTILLGAYANQEIPFEKIVEAVRPARTLSYGPVFQAMFAWHSAPPRAVSRSGIDFMPLTTPLPTAQFDLSLSLEERAGAIGGTLNYASDLFDAATMDRWVACFEVVVQSMARDPGASIERLSLIDDAERARVLQSFSSAEGAAGIDDVIPALFAAQVQRTPHVPAVICGEHSLSYRELDERSGQLARYLVRTGAGPDVLVGIFMERSVETIVSLLGTLKAGAAYVPLDPRYPRERLAQILKDAAPLVVLTQSALRDHLAPTSGMVVALDGDWGEIAQEPGTDVEPCASDLRPHHLAYVIYTSGSTGVPKGVMIEHRSVVNLFQGLENLYRGSRPCSRIALNASLNFDASVQQVVQLLAGRTLVLVPHEVRQDPAELIHFLDKQQIDAIDCTPSQLKTWIDAGLLESGHRGLRVVLVGGEAIDAGLWSRLSSQIDVDFYNVYGPTECTVDATVAHLNGDPSPPHIGRPMPNRRVYILDPEGRVLPIGVAGEICVAAAGVGRGYLNRSPLSAERFVADPFGSAHDRMYRTGDLGRWRADACIEYLGRNDNQVKIRGFRIELGEIEANLIGHQRIRQAVVVAREDVPGEKSLVAYYVAKQAESCPTVEELRAHLLLTLPEHMVPSAFVALKRLPETPSGKVDRRALPAPDLGSYASRQYQAPRGDVEEILASTWQAVLRVERVGRQDNFFELGGHSLLIMQMMERLRRVGLSIQVRCVFESRNLADLAATLTREGGGHFEVPPNLIPAGCEVITPQMLPLVELDERHLESIVRNVPGGAANIEDIYPLVPLQEGILFHHLLDGGDTYVLGTALLVASRARLDELIAALQSVIDRHAILRTAVLWEGLPRPVQIVCRRATLPIEEFVLDPAQEVLRQIDMRLEPGKQHMDLRRAPLIRLMVAADPLGSGQWYALLQSHHITTDHVTSEAVISEVVAHLQGQAQIAGVRSVPYRNHVARALACARAENAETYFREELGSVDEPTAPFGLLNVKADSTGISEARSRLDADLVRGVRMHARRLSVSTATLFHAAWALVVARTSGRDDVVFGSVLLGRLHQGAGTQEMLGLFINTLPMRVELHRATVREVVERTQRGLVELLNHEHASLSAAQRCSGIAGGAPLFTSLFNFRHSTPDPTGSWSGADGIRTLATKERTNYPITVSVDDFGEDLEVLVQTDPRIDSRRVADYLQTALQAMTKALECAPEMLAADIAVMPDRERVEILRTLNGTREIYPDGKLIHRLFEEQVERTPAAEAVVQGTRSLTYAELNDAANRLAHYLRSRGVGADHVVAIAVDRSLEMAIGLLAILKAGGAYVPIDPGYPPERLQYMLEDAAPTLVLVQRRTKAILPTTSAELVDLDTLSAELSESRSDNPSAPAGLSARNGVYVIYTSGSTGRPKGTVMSHGAVANLLAWQRRTLDAAGVRVLQFAALSFDVAFQETFSTLCGGGTLVLLDESVRRDLPALLTLLNAQHIQRLFLPPLMLQNLAEWANTSRIHLPALQDIVTAGEQLRISPEIAKFFDRMSGCRLHNHYGPTETHVVTSLTLDGSPQRWPTLPSIGKPIANTQIYILDGRRMLVPFGAQGEIYIGGANVARGYLHRPDLTAERFMPDPFSADPDARMYKTGDLGRWQTDGTVEYLGRNDDQVKIRGYRIEPGEVEAKLAQHERISEVAVIVREDIPGLKRLVAYVTESGQGGVRADELRTHLLGALPEYMVPSAFVFLPSLPMTPSGKLDRRALPPPGADSVAAGRREPPSGKVEQAVATIWQEVLGVESIGRDDDFFDLGGHSLLALKALLRVNQACGCTLRVTDIYRNPTVRTLAAGIGGDTVEDDLVDLACEAVIDSKLTANPSPRHATAGAILLTGATGFVGRFLLASLLHQTTTQVHCLVRAKSTSEAATRLRAALLKWDLWDDGCERRVIAVPGDLRQPRLGLDEHTHAMLSHGIDSIYHCATSMNHLETYAMAKPANVDAVGELLRIATSGRPKVINYVSTLGVFGASALEPLRAVDELTPIDGEKYRRSQGYLASKWVAEKMFMTANERGIPCNIFRPGLVWADSQQGRFDELQHVHRVLKSCILSGYGIANYQYSMPPTPVDYVAQAITCLAMRHPNGGGIFHISSPDQAIDDVFERCGRIIDAPLELLPHFEWIREMKRMHHSGRSLPVVPLIEFAFGMDEAAFREHQANVRVAGNIRFDCARTAAELEHAGIVAPVVNDELLALCLEDMISRDDELRARAGGGADHWNVTASISHRGAQHAVKVGLT